jgi:hypothetical protein
MIYIFFIYLQFVLNSGSLNIPLKRSSTFNLFFVFGFRYKKKNKKNKKTIKINK